jgi:hypothetical protein
MNPEPRLVGIQPWFPGFLGRWGWLTEAIPAERMAALRIVTAIIVIADILFSYLPDFATLFSPAGLGGRDLYPWRFQDGQYFWSIIRWLPDSWGPGALMAVWLGSAVALLVGWRPFVSGLVVWACGVSVWNINPGLHNGGDRMRNTLLLAVAVSCSASVWGVSSVRRSGDQRPVFVPGWPAKILIVQLAVLYFFGGWYKVISPAWRSGYVMYFASHDLAWSITPSQSSSLPVGVHMLSAWVTVAWELGFPVLVMLRGTRPATLCLGVLFHLVTFFTLEVGCFALYSLAAYVVFVPWERYFGTGGSELVTAERTPSPLSIQK